MDFHHTNVHLFEENRTSNYGPTKAHATTKKGQHCTHHMYSFPFHNKAKGRHHNKAPQQGKGKARQQGKGKARQQGTTPRQREGKTKN